MRIMITYFSQTGNTEKVAKAIKEALIEHDVDCKPVKETDSSEISDYDLLILGSGIYAGKVHKSVLDLIRKAEALPPKVALFSTHASVTGYQHGFKVVQKKIESIDSEIIAEWDCRGENLGLPKEMIQKRLASLPPEERKKAEEDQAQLKGRPNAEDLENAKKFAKSLIR